MPWLITYFAIGITWATVSLLAAWAALSKEQKQAAKNKWYEAVPFFMGTALKLTITWPWSLLKNLAQFISEQQAGDQK